MLARLPFFNQYCAYTLMRLSAWLDIVQLKVDPEGNDTGPHKQDEEGDDEVPKGTK